MRRYTKLGTMKPEVEHTVYQSGGLMIIAMNLDRRDSLYDYVGTRASAYQSLAPKAAFAIAFLIFGAVLAASFLALSILQGGMFDLVLDGDLFKVMLTFLADA